ncbi:VOC family protein [Deinococcus ruber]|uniref:Glyoxalase n=1 Tax=Deinococcus ruber TaxID=1848197 RepID=A0A918CAV7_9DEIO|nr:VOC family protein [Deinococcus ruber]GGR14972.1 glyoxalase [Deinococcus ruber]
MLRIGSVVWGVRDVARATEFWSQALHYRPREEPSDDWVVLVPTQGTGPQLALKQVSSEAENHRRHHLDLYTADQGAEVERLLSLGAVRVDWRYEPGADYVVLADLDGNRFCVVQKDS